MEPTKILLVDDSKLMHKMYEVMLRRYTTVSAFNGQEALDKLAEHDEVDLVLLDINMPVMSGLEFLENLDRSVWPDLPVIIITTEGKEADSIRGLEAGATAYIKKPFLTEEILEIIYKIETSPAA